ncbi:hypothetical protein PESHB4_01170 [Pediococcus ethanolidurans]
MPSYGSPGLERGGHDLKPRRTLVFKLGLILSNKLLRIISPLRPITSGLRTLDASIMLTTLIS